MVLIYKVLVAIIKEIGLRVKDWLKTVFWRALCLTAVPVG